MKQESLLAESGTAKNAKEAWCRCGHAIEHHDAKGKCTYGKGTRFGGCSCKRRAPRGRLVVVQPPELEAPLDAIVLMRPDTKRPKSMGWAMVGATNVVIYLEQLKTKSPNVTNRIFGGHFSPSMQRRMIASMASERKLQCEKAMSAIEQCHVLERGRPAKVVITRISTGKLDDDNLAGSQKATRDGVAEALLIDDKEFSIAGEVDGAVALYYRQAAPGKRGVFGVRIEIFWGSA